MKHATPFDAARARSRSPPPCWPPPRPAPRPMGEVDTAFKLIGPDHKIVIEAYDDPKVNGVTCYVSRAKTGGIAGAFGVAEDKAEA